MAAADAPVHRYDPWSVKLPYGVFVASLVGGWRCCTSPRILLCDRAARQLMTERCGVNCVRTRERVRATSENRRVIASCLRFLAAKMLSSIVRTVIQGS
jgi:hypothetical protein